jgi:uncharacterized YigZ family protein
MTDARFALAAPAHFVQEIRKSKFAANAANVDSPAAAARFIEQASDASASHNCWAWRVGNQYRFNDDGEPAGTAGKPILQAIDGHKLDGVAVVVTRWFGGIKLGAGGLVRAYGGSAAECLRCAAKIERIEMTRVEFDLDLGNLGVLARLRSRLREVEAIVEAETFAERAHLILCVPVKRLEELRSLLADATRGQAQLRPIS